MRRGCTPRGSTRPRVYAPRVYAPRVYAPNSYAPDLPADPAFRDAFSAAQNQTLLVVSVNSGTGATGAETATVSTGNNQGYFYVRVQGHDDQAFDAATPSTSVSRSAASRTASASAPSATSPCPAPRVRRRP